MASIHRKSKTGTWYITYWQDGKQKHRSLGTQSERKARRLQREIELTLQDTGYADVVITERPRSEFKNPKADEFWTQFSEWAQTHRSKSAVEEYRAWFTQFVEFAKLDRLGDATPAQVEAFKTKLLSQGKRKPKGVGLQKLSINNALRTLKTVWNHARKLNLYSGENPFYQVEKFSLPQLPDKRFLDGPKVDTLLKATEQYAFEKYVKEVEARNIRIAVALMALAGLRKKEVCFARWEWVCWENKVLTVSNHKEFTTKNKRSRVVSMHEDLVRILEPYRQEEGYILESTRQNEGRNRYRADFRKSFERVCQLAGIKTTPHGLRHSFASRQAVRGRSLHVIAGWLGHSTTWVTERYAHFQQEYDANVNDM